MSGLNLAPTSTVVAGSEQISSQLDDEAVILALRDGVYYGVNPVGARVWALVQTPRTVEEICSTIQSEYDVEAARCERDVIDLLHRLEGSGLVEVTHAAGP